MFTKVQIILDKGKTKAKMLVWYDITDAFYILGIGLFGYVFGGLFSALFQIILSLTFACIMAFLLFELPNSLSIYKYIKLGYKYYFKSPKVYCYLPGININDEEVEENEEKEQETKIKHKRKKTKRQGKIKTIR